MQLLEHLSTGDIILQEGLFKSSASDADYDIFLKMTQLVCDKIKLPTDSKKYLKNKKVLENAKEKHPSSIVIRSVKGKSDKLISFNKARNARSISSLYANDIIMLIHSKYKLKDDNRWLVTLVNGIETYREINLWGPLGDSSWVNIHFMVTNYKSKIEETTMTFRISKMNDRRKKKYEKA